MTRKFKSSLVLQLISIILFLNVFTLLHGQTFILNEDFSSSEGTTPPAGWHNGAVVGGENDLWHFDNPANQRLVVRSALFEEQDVKLSIFKETFMIEVCELSIPPPRI